MNQKKIFTSLFIFIALFCLFSISRAKENENGMTADRVIITSVSTTIDIIDGDAQGSINGGTLVYIKAQGHNRSPSKNRIEIGPYPCIVEENAISGDIISCRTTRAFDKERRWGQLVVLYVEGKLPSKCEAEKGCRFNYSESKTPQLQIIEPNVATPDSVINWKATWRVENTSDITKLKVGEFNCNRFQLDDADEPINLNDDEEVTKNNDQNLPCQLAPNMPAGYYSVDAKIKYGNFFKKATSSNLSADGQNQYDVVVTAEIKSISSSTGGEYGNRLIIEGSGFSDIPEQVQVTVGDLVCTVVSVQSKQIICDLESGETQTADDENGNIASFQSGTGLQITHWQFDHYPIDMEEFIQKKNDGILPEERIITEQSLGIWEYQIDDEYYKDGIYARGFFKAPRSGNYRFWLSADDQAQVYLNQTPNDTAFNAANLIVKKCSYTNFRNYLFPATCDENQIYSQQVNLEAGQNYWLELFLLDTGGKGHFTLSVETPAPTQQQQGDERWSNALDEIQKVEIIPQSQNQRFSIKFYASEEEFQLHFFYQNAYRVVELDKKTDLKTWDQWTDNEFVESFDKAAGGKFGAQLFEAHKLNSQGERCTDCVAEGREWIIDFTKYRPSPNYNITPTCIKSSGQCIIQRLQDQSTPVSGTFSLNFGGEPIQVIVAGIGYTTDIPYDIHGDKIRSGIFDTINDDYLNLQVINQGAKEDGYAYLFNFRSTINKQQLPLLQADASGLSGGVNGQPQIQVSRMVPSSPNPFYEPIPFDMTFIESKKPQVEVTIKGIPSKCSTDCTYQTDNSLNAQITSFSLQQSTLTLNLSDVSGVQLDNGDITVNYAGSNCKNLTGDLSSFECTLDTIEAGQYVPSVLVKGLGFLQSTASTQDIIPTVSAVEPQTVGTNGGKQITITGTGFPVKNIDQISVTIGGEQAQVLSTSNTSIAVITPVLINGGAQPIIVSSFGQDSTSFNGLTYDASGVATVTQIQPQTASPVIKQDIVITGTNFGSNLADIQVWLEDSETGEQVYQLNVLPSNLSNTQITARLGGGHVGTYNLVVYNILGSSISTNNVNQFKYIIELSQVSIQQGHDLGGQIVTLTGTNFSKILTDNSVFLSDGIKHSQCFIISVNEYGTEIVVRTPPKNPEFNSNTVEFVVQGRLIEESICTGDCTFTYTGTGSAPSINELSTSEFTIGQTVELTGENLVVTGENSVATLEVNGEKYQGDEIILVNSDSSVTVTIPDLPVGNYMFLIYLGNNGLAGGFEVEIQFTSKEITPNQFGLFGTDITISGSGFDEDTTVTVNKLNCPVISFTSSTITCVAPIQPEYANNLEVYISKPGFDAQKSEKKVHIKSDLNVTANTNLQGQTTKTWDISAILQSDFSTKAEYKVHSTPASANFSFDLVDFVEDQDLEVFLQSVQNPKIRLVGSISGSTVTFQNTVAGLYKILVKYPGKGFAQLPAGSVWEVEFTLPTVSITSGAQTGLNGGSTLTLSGAGFSSEQLESNNVIVCGQLCDITDATYNSLECTLPKINTEYLEEIQGTPDTLLTPIFAENVNLIKSVTTSRSNGSDVTSEWDYSDDYNLINLSENNNTECWVQFEAYDDSKIIFQSAHWNLIERYRAGEVIVQQEEFYYEFTVQGTNDASDEDSWVELADNNPYDKVNYRYKNQQQANYAFGGFKIDENITPYKYIRVSEKAKTSDRFNTCKYHSIDLYGQITYKQSITTAQDITCDVKTIVNKQSSTLLSQAITYQAATTPIVENVSPQYVSIVGGENITITGQNLENASVFIDGIECIVDTNTSSQIVCETQRNSQNDVYSVLTVLVNEVPAIISKEVFFYSGLIYSDEINTWSGESVPRDGDSVFVPKGQTLIIDESNEGVLNTIVVEGTLVFQDNNNDIELKARYIVVRQGKFIVGSKYQPFTNNLTITMFGVYEDKQLPEFGNKVLGCHTCHLEIHGQPKLPTWSTLQTTVQKGATSITINGDNINWQVGDLIGIAPTGYYPDENEERIIASITNSGDGYVITFEEALEYQHISATETFSGKDITMEAEVVNLTRNVKFQGNPEDSITLKYGGHIKVHGSSIDGSLVRISQVEFQYTGQPQIIGRYNIHFHMIGNAIRSYVQGVAVHDSFARIVAVHSVHNLLIKDNVGYNNQGHNIFLEDGSETGNVVESNVVISPKSAFNMLQTDITVAGIWVTHPSNYVRYNRVAGSQFYGMWYEIKERVGTHPDVCPIGNKILQIEYNVGHSNTRFGERFFNLQPRKYPCRHYRNNLLEDPWAENPSVQSVFTGGNYWKNGESGILAEFVGNSIFKDYLLADNYRTGFQSHVTNFTAEYVIFKDSVVVGQTEANGGQPEDQPYETSAILVPRTNGFLAKNIAIHNMPAGYNIIESSSENQFVKMWTQGGYQAELEELTLVNCENAGILKWQGGPKRHIVYDRDGSLTGTGQPTWITPHYNFHEQLVRDGICTKETEGYSQESVVCSRPFRGIRFAAMEKKDLFVGQKLRVFNLNDEVYADDFGTENEEYDQFVEQKSWKIKNRPYKDLKDGFATILATGYTYNLHWNEGIDFSHALIFPSYLAEEGDLTTILRFNYTENRELFDIYRMIGGEQVESFSQGGDLSRFVDNNNVPNSSESGCTFGEYYLDKEDQFLYLCINGKSKPSTFQQIEINPVYCRDTCSSGFDCPAGTEKVSYNFNPNNNQLQYTDVNNQQAMVRTHGSIDEEAWEYRVPQQGDDVWIPCNWALNFDMAEWEFGTLIIDGTLRIDESLDNVHLKATNIWVRGGKFIAGGPGVDAYTKNLTIELLGTNDSLPLIIDDLSKTGTKSMAVTSRLELYGQYPSTTQTRLTSTVNAGDNTITVQDDISEWKVGEEIVIGASTLDGLGYEKHTILEIDPQTKTIVLEGEIADWHYGHQFPTVAPSYDSEIMIEERFGGELDMRTVVGHITRNIKMIGSQEGQLGGHLQVYHYVKTDNENQENNIDARGSAVLQGVEFSNMGQHASENAGLHILYTNLETDSERQYTIVEGSSFHDCFGYCLNGSYADLVKIQNNVFYKGEKFLIQALEGKQWTITDNLLIGATLRQGATDLGQAQGLWDPVALIHMYTPYLPSQHQHDVRRNIGSGSEGIGYVFPGTPCEEKDQNQFTDNEAGFISFTGVLFNLKENRCYATGHLQVFQARVGLCLNMDMANDGFQAEKIIIAECDRNLILHSASNNYIIHNNYLQDAWISAYVRTDCEDCYTEDRNGVNTSCSGQNGIQLHVITQKGETFPLYRQPFIYDVICTPPSVYGSMFIDDVELHNFRNTYSTEDFPFGGQCGNNIAFENHKNAASASAGHYFNRVKCINCEYEALFYIMQEKEFWAGWFGGCGNDICTGLSNILVQDLTGDLLGHKGTVIGHNEFVGDSLEECQWIPSWNTFDCRENLDLGILEWNSEGADQQEISPIPVFVTNDDYSNKINMWREWNWQGPEPLNKRLNRFSSIISINQWHKITYSGTQSVNLVYKLQQRSTIGETNRHIVIQTSYPSPLLLELRVQGQLIKPFPFTAGEDLNAHATVCGANNYYFNNSTIHFVVTNVPDCQVQVRQVNQVQVNLRVTMTKEEFYSDSAKQTDFTSRISAYLSISTDQIRIVGLSDTERRILEEEEQSPSTVIKLILAGDEPSTLTQGYNPASQYILLKEQADSLINGSKNQSLDLGVQIEDAYYEEIIVLKEAGKDGQAQSSYFQESDLSASKGNPQEKKEEKDSGLLTLALALIFTIIGAIVIAIISYHFWKKRQVKSISNNLEIPKDDVVLEEKQQVKQVVGTQPANESD